MLSGARHWLYKTGLLPVVDLPACVVSVGNLSLGGTGKSPFVFYLARWALAQGIPTAVLSRGYGRKNRELQIVPPYAKLPTAEFIGDEPWMIKNRLPGLSLLVHPDRATMALEHWQALGNPRLVLLDDGFQHWRARRDRDVLMLDATESLSQGVVPFGRLREKATALGRADFVVITRAESVDPKERKKLAEFCRRAKPVPAVWKKERQAEVKVVEVDYAFEHFFRVSTGEACERPKEKNLLLATGIAKPAGVGALAKSLGLPIKGECVFPDHHSLQAKDVQMIRERLKALGDSALVITEKDWARWQHALQGIPAYGLAVKFHFLENSEAVVEDFLREVELCSTSR